MTRGRTDEPLTTDAEVRIQRSRRMSRLLRRLYDLPEIPAEEDDDLAQWLSKCLLAHEVDTLAMLVDDDTVKRAVVTKRGAN